MKKKLLMMLFLVGSGSIYSQIIKFKEITPLFKMSFENQLAYLKKIGYILDEKSVMPETYGWDWKHSEKDFIININRVNNDVSMVQCRLKANENCFNKLLQEALKKGLKRDYEKVTSSTQYYYYKNDSYGLETAQWTSSGKKYFQFNLININYYEELKHHWDNY